MEIYHWAMHAICSGYTNMRCSYLHPVSRCGCRRVYRSDGGSKSPRSAPPGSARAWVALVSISWWWRRQMSAISVECSRGSLKPGAYWRRLDRRLSALSSVTPTVAGGVDLSKKSVSRVCCRPPPVVAPSCSVCSLCRWISSRKAPSLR